jgi:hypothetical protein
VREFLFRLILIKVILDIKKEHLRCSFQLKCSKFHQGKLAKKVFSGETAIFDATNSLLLSFFSSLQ